MRCRLNARNNCIRTEKKDQGKLWYGRVKKNTLTTRQGQASVKCFLQKLLSRRGGPTPSEPRIFSGPWHHLTVGVPLHVRSTSMLKYTVTDWINSWMDKKVRLASLAPFSAASTVDRRPIVSTQTSDVQSFPPTLRTSANCMYYDIHCISFEALRYFVTAWRRQTLGRPLASK